uniref:KICSTOR complex protein SZT2-like isoform X2 n=1 Tax=Crassostrea virginica TaxID=6565 RepID=A0A8B8CNQ6_CRAVI|nr:KICSTOR complex protein SZT2-like isoform X2 [Crassostrea virginica]
MMFGAKRDEMMTLAPDKDADTMSVTSAGSSTPRMLQDYIIIDVYGVQPAGTKLQLNLMDMLQRRLDDAVLDIISLQLSRNPNIKLMPEDIRFIQKPMQDVCSDLLLTIPSVLPVPLSPSCTTSSRTCPNFPTPPTTPTTSPRTGSRTR